MDDEEEVLVSLAEILPSQLDNAGGPQYAEHVLRPLEKLCASEETTVREQVSAPQSNPLFNHHLGLNVSNLATFCEEIGHCKCQANIGHYPNQRL